MSPSRVRLLARTSAVLAVVACLAWVILALVAGPELMGRGHLLVSTVGFASFLAVGTVVMLRRPDHRIGWLLVAIGWSALLRLLAVGYAAVALDGRPPGLPAGVAAAWIGQWSGWPAIVLAFTALLLLFPSGDVVSRRWRWALRAGVVGLAGLMVSSATVRILSVDASADGSGTVVRVPNPLAVSWQDSVGTIVDVTSAALVLGAALCGVASLLVRFRRGSVVTRLQLKWLMTAAIASAVLVIVNNALRVEGPHVEVVWGLALLSLPVAVGVAVLRYRLYDIDRVVSRTMSYVLLSGVLVGVYALGALGVGALLPGESSDVLVAGSTLATAALFRPLRSRIQALVDRRFNRSRYDAAQTVEAFGARLRDEVDLGALSHELRVAVDAALQPRVASLWLREGGR